MEIDCPQIGCAVCGRVLTDEERYYYEVTCEECETETLEEYMKDRSGPPDAIDPGALH